MWGRYQPLEGQRLRFGKVEDLGIFTGPTLAIYRFTMGVTDIALSPFWVFPVMSPEARWNWFGVEYDE